MKTVKSLNRLATMIVTASLAATAVSAQSDYIAHEWGTFTSVQGGDGELLPWRPLQSSELPNFVYNWSKAGLNRLPAGRMFVGKGQMVTLQRMETPVIYFYANHRLNVDASVDFPKGVITEWYPQATQIGPSTPRSTNAPATAITSESRAVWKNLKLVTSIKNQRTNELPQDKSGCHYYAARETSSAYVQTEMHDGTNHATETEKFIFYRGAGSFKTPLHIRVDEQNSVTVENRGAEKLEHLFLVSIHDHGNGKNGTFVSMKDLTDKQPRRFQNLETMAAAVQPVEKFQKEIAAQLADALVSAGLFRKEAQAMVDTWRDSWFAEEGDRVLYILPRTWTDETLPLTLNPKPEKLVRVMVGRAEILTPAAENHLSEILVKAANGGSDERKAATRELKALGRFAEPALRLARLDTGPTNALELSYQLMFETTLAPETAGSKFE